MKLITTLFIFASLAFGQEARILIVEKADSQKLADAYKEYKAAQKRWEALKVATAKTYTPVDDKGKVVEEWKTIQFSADFRAIVPADSQYAARSGCFYGYSYGPNSGSVLTGSTASNLIGVAPIGNISSNSMAVSNPDLFVDNVRADLKTTERKQ